MLIRRVELKDLQTFVKLYELSYRGLEEYAYIKDKDIRDYFKWLFKRDSEGFLTIELDGPIAFIACDTNWFSPLEYEVLGEIHEIFVHPDYRRICIGSTLLDKAIKYARDKGRRIVGLWVGVKNLVAKEFYKKKGFIEKESIGKWTRMIKILNT
ncbi:MAG: GNAT family N-acetyltransferase [Nitrososphaerota archaeon]|nr:GNAT family N-acetyltransferase [Nitrososphaerales archaeon]MDW8045009.1 GNAT family N-acetyltransferase [Nitrososphaerota archaeon]